MESGHGGTRDVPAHARTREAYIASVANLAKFYRTAPGRLSEQQVQDYLLYLIEKRKLAWSSVNVVSKCAEVVLSGDFEAQGRGVRGARCPAPASRSACHRFSHPKR